MRLAFSLLLSGLALLPGCRHTLPDPFFRGVLRYDALVQVAGMPAQLAPLRQHAASRGWEVVCEGISGEETVLRLRLPATTTRVEIDQYFGDPDRPRGNRTSFFYRGMETPQTCDEEPTIITTLPASGNGAVRLNPRLLAVGPPDTIQRLAKVAAECGFPGAQVRPFQDGDVTPRPENVPQDWFSLLAADEPTTRPGPLGCFVQKQGEEMSRETNPDG